MENRLIRGDSDILYDEALEYRLISSSDDGCIFFWNFEYKLEETQLDANAIIEVDFKPKLIKELKPQH